MTTIKRALGITFDVAGFLITLATGQVGAAIALVPLLSFLAWIGVLP